MRKKKTPREFKEYLESKIGDRDLVEVYRILYESSVLPAQKEWDLRSKKHRLRWKKLIRWFILCNPGNRLGIHKKFAEMMLWGSPLIFISGMVILALPILSMILVSIGRNMLLHVTVAPWLFLIWLLICLLGISRLFFIRENIYRTFLREETLFPSLKNMVNEGSFLVDEAIIDRLVEIPSCKLERVYRSIDYGYGIISDSQRTSAFVKLLSTFIVSFLFYVVGFPKEVSGDLTKQLGLFASVLSFTVLVVEMLIFACLEKTIKSYRRCKYLIKEAKEIKEAREIRASEDTI